MGDYGYICPCCGRMLAYNDYVYLEFMSPVGCEHCIDSDEAERMNYDKQDAGEMLQREIENREPYWRAG